MKKILYVLGVCTLLLISGCGKSSEQSEENKITKDEVEEQNSSEETGEKATIYANSYLKIINEIVNTHGILSNDDKLGGNEGLAYVDLLDFNNDGALELYVVYEISGATENGYPAYKEEVWTEQSDEPWSLYSNEHGDFGAVQEGSIYVLTAPDGKSYFNESGELANEGSTTYFDVFYGDDGFTIEELARAEKQESYAGATGELGYRYTITEGEDTQTVTEEDYKQFLEKYGKDNAKKVINSDQGYKSLAIDLTDNKEKINDFIKTLEKIANTQ